MSNSIFCTGRRWVRFSVCSTLTTRWDECLPRANTLSPSRNPVTPGPTAWIRPTAVYPGVSRGPTGRIGIVSPSFALPASVERSIATLAWSGDSGSRKPFSLPALICVRLTRIITCPGSGSATSNASTSTRLRPTTLSLLPIGMSLTPAVTVSPSGGSPPS